MWGSDLMAAGTSALPSASAPVPGSASRRGLRSLTTPGRLRLASVVVTLGVVVLGLVVVRVATDRRDAAAAVESEASRLVVDAEELYVALADADAAASTAFLRAGLEPPDLRDRYVEDVRGAGLRLAGIGGQPNLSAKARAAISSMTADLPTYTGRVETARTNSRLGYPVGQTQLRSASKLMREQILPAATIVYDDAARQLYGSYRSGTSRSAVAAVAVAAAVLVVLLVVTQVFLTRRTKRLVNLGLAAATLLVLALGVWALVAFDAQERALVRSQREGSDQLIVLSTARVLALRSLSDENLDLIERGTEQAHQEDFKATIASIGEPDGGSGLLATAAELAERTSSEHRVEDIAQRYAEYLAVHDRVRELSDDRQYDEAVDVAVNDEALAAAALDDSFGVEITAARQRLDAHAREARQAHQALRLAVIVMAAVTAALALFGLQQRIREYR